MSDSEGEEQPLLPRARPVSHSRRWFATFNLALVNMAVMINFAILAPFFPGEAARKGVSTTTVGIIFGEFEFIQVFASPVFGLLLPKMGAKMMFLVGIFVSGVCGILFGVLDYCPHGIIFVVSCLAVRGVMALGSSMLFTASFTIIAITYPDNVATMFGFLETFSGIGLMLGPPIGGALYQVGGFLVPFVAVGGLLLIILPIIAFTLNLPSDALPSHSGSYLGTLLNPHISAIAVMMWAAAVSIGFLDPIYQPFLQQNYHLNELLVGLIFVCAPVCYAILAPVAGYICDRKPITKEMMSLSMLIIGVGMMLINPSPLLNIGPPRLWLTIIAALIYGVGVSGCLVPSTNAVLSECFLMGYPDDLGTFSLVSGFMNSCLALGFFSGPLIGATLTDHFGFGWATTAMGLLAIAMGFLYGLYTVIFLYCRGGRQRQVPSSIILEEEMDSAPLMT